MIENLIWQVVKECIKTIVGEKKCLEEAEPLLNGCAVHCLRFCETVATLSVDSVIQPHFMSLCKRIRDRNDPNELREFNIQKH
jgi:hypothetical protein